MKRNEDVQIVCQDCRLPFTWTAGEQRFYAELGYDAPKRCPACRAHLRRNIGEAEERRQGGLEVQRGRK